MFVVGKLSHLPSMALQISKHFHPRLNYARGPTYAIINLTAFAAIKSITRAPTGLGTTFPDFKRTFASQVHFWTATSCGGGFKV